MYTYTIQHGTPLSSRLRALFSFYEKMLHNAGRIYP